MRLTLLTALALTTVTAIGQPPPTAVTAAENARSDATNAQCSAGSQRIICDSEYVFIESLCIDWEDAGADLADVEAALDQAKHLMNAEGNVYGGDMDTGDNSYSDGVGYLNLGDQQFATGEATGHLSWYAGARSRYLSAESKFQIALTYYVAVFDDLVLISNSIEVDIDRLNNEGDDTGDGDPVE